MFHAGQFLRNTPANNHGKRLVSSQGPDSRKCKALTAAKDVLFHTLNVLPTSLAKTVIHSCLTINGLGLPSTSDLLILFNFLINFYNDC